MGCLELMVDSKEDRVINWGLWSGSGLGQECEMDVTDWLGVEDLLINYEVRVRVRVRVRVWVGCVWELFGGIKYV